jgi:hypothetical protein
MIGSIKALKKVFGDKASRDLKEMSPTRSRYKAEFTKLQAWTTTPSVGVQPHSGSA